MSSASSVSIIEEAAENARWHPGVSLLLVWLSGPNQKCQTNQIDQKKLDL